MAEKITKINLQNLIYDKNYHNKADKEIKNFNYIKDKISAIIGEKHAEEMALILRDREAHLRLKDLIKKYIIQEKLILENEDIESLTERVYDSIAGYGFLKKYIEDEEVEEINVNAYDNIWVLYPKEKKRIAETFATPKECETMIKKISAMSGLVLDGSSPTGDTYISKGVRMSAAIPPVIEESVGASCSIRKQKKNSITKEKMIEFGTTTQEQLDFLVACLKSGLSIAIAGETGSGKTADMNYLLSQITNKRLYTIEDTKELELDEFNERGERINDLVQFYTKEPPNPVTMNDLLRLALRYDPDIIVPAEMRGEEAQTAVEAGRTNHTILSSLHANSAKGAYKRILTMYLMGKSNLSRQDILEMIVEAFPIVLYKNKLEDGTRKYMQVFEATGLDEHGNVKGNMIYKFNVESIIKDEKGKITQINGKHKKVSSISEELAERMKIKGIDEELIKRFKREDDDAY